ncbi:MAG TPA: hypothetical protein VIA62_24140 [Thermoanaerobaculia bacterium]|jgi:hypothetical protein|nr:hypothetical protein [Thermoanaerobaculia bacterium]
MMNRKMWTAALCLGLTALVGSHRLGAADKPSPGNQALAAKMLAEGWKPIAVGVYERQRGPNKVEHMGYGREGLVWTVGELNRQLTNLMQEYQSYPSEDLARVIDHLSVKVANAQREIQNTKSLTSVTEAVSGGGCSICYSATADAYYLTSTQGVGAIADASFNSNCGYSGDTYAYVFARATLNGTTTTVTQEDPHTGTSVTSHASASVYGSADCSSTANSYAQSTALGISYTTSDSNSSCPPVANPLAATISGPSSAYGSTCRTLTWTSTVTGGTSPYTYAWTIDGTSAGTGTSASRTFCSYTIETATVNLTVYDSAGHNVAASPFYTDIDIERTTTCPGCQIP